MILFESAEEDEWMARAVAKLVLGEIRADFVDPDRELPGLVEPANMPINAQKDFLYQVFGHPAVTYHVIDEVDEARLVALDELGEGLFVAVDVGPNDLDILKNLEVGAQAGMDSCLARAVTMPPCERTKCSMATILL